MNSVFSSWMIDTAVYRDDDEFSAQVRAQHMGAIVQLMPLMVVGNVLNAYVSVALMLPSVGWVGLTAWAAMITLVCSYILRRWHHNKNRQVTHVSARGISKLVKGVAWLAMLWNIPFLLWMPHLDHQGQLGLAVILTGLSAGGAMLLVAIPHAALAWLLTLGAGMLLSPLQNGRTEFYYLIPVAALYLVILSLGVKKMSKHINARLVSERDAERQGQMVSILLQDFEDHTKDLLWEVDAELRLVYVSNKISNMVGLSKHIAIGTDLVKVLEDQAHGGQACVELQQLAVLFNQAQPFRDITIPMHRDGTTEWWSLRAKPLWSKRGELQGWRGVLCDVTLDRKAQSELEYQARHDLLTGLFNRNQFNVMLTKAVAQSAAKPCLSALAIIDLDNFKAINDGLGHRTGDLMLQNAAQQITRVVQATDIAARLGGDEFAIIFQDIVSQDHAHVLAQTVLDHICINSLIDGRSVSTKASIGIAMIANQGERAEDLLVNADLALYAAKHQGGNSVVVYSPTLSDSKRRSMLIEADLRTALKSNHLYMVWQPVCYLRSGTVASVEALMRWKNPVLGLVSPQEFIPIAEKTGQIYDIGLWGFQEACRVAVKHFSNLLVSVNVSVVQLKNTRFLIDIDQVLFNTGMAASGIEIEITESVFMDENPLIFNNLRGLQSRGMRVALDDFGTGYSAFQYLRRFAFNTLKIDQAFIRDIMTESDASTIVRSLIDLAAALGMHTVAEGVETEQQWNLLKDMGCLQAQGYYFSKPIGIDDLLERLPQWLSLSATQPAT